MNITAIENNFGAQDITLRAYLSERMVILEGIIPVDTSSTLYQSADSLVLTFDTEFPFRLSSMSAAVLASGDGMDCYKVDNTLGGGALAPLADGKIVMGDNYETYNRICNGPIRTKVVFTYKPFDVDGHQVTLKREMTVDANTNFIKISNWYNAASDKLPVVLGAVLHNVLSRTDGDHYIAFTEKASDSADPDADGNIHVGLVVDAAEQDVTVGTVDGHAVLEYNITPGKRADVWTGSGWSKGGIATPEEWAEMVEDFAYAQAHPLEVTVK